MNHSSNLLITPDTGLPEILMSHPQAMLFFEHFGIQVPLKRKTVAQIFAPHLTSVPSYLLLLPTCMLAMNPLQIRVAKSLICP